MREPDRASVESNPPGHCRTTSCWRGLDGTSVALPGRVLPRFYPLVLALVALTACGFDPGDDAPMTPPAVYRQWWAKTEACSGLQGDFDRIEWSVVPGYGFKCKS